MASSRRLGALGVGLAAMVGCGVAGVGQPAAAEKGEATTVTSPFRDFAIVDEFPHDRAAYTQGLVASGGSLLEGTGRYGQSSLRLVDLATGRVRQRVDLDPSYFGEGIAVLDDRIFQLTWRSGRGFIYGRDHLDLVGEFRYETEGWGLASDGTHLIMSDGTALLYFLDPASFEVVRTLEVRDADGPVQMLNELEVVEDAILANVWQEEVILEISPETGAVTAEFDFAGLVAYEGAQGLDSVLNGIAYDAETKRLFVTGKLWSHVYEVELRRSGR